jgi:hypothetical protein
MRVAKTERIEGGSYFPSGGKRFRITGQGAPVGDGTPAIVSEEAWERANELASSRRRAPARRSRDWLVGRVFCSTCNLRLSRFRHSTRGYAYWRCRTTGTGGCCRLRHVLDKVVRSAAAEQLAKFLADPAVREAKLQRLRANLADPEWEREHERNAAEIARLKAKMAKLLAAFGDDEGMEELLADQIKAIKEQVAAREEIAAGLAARVAAAGRATEAVDRVRGLLGPWPAGLLEGPDGPKSFLALEEEDQRLVAETVGLRVELARCVPGQVAVQVSVFQYEFLNSYLTERLPTDTFCG